MLGEVRLSFGPFQEALSHNYCNSKLTIAPLFGPAVVTLTQHLRPSANGSPKHRWKQRHGAEGSLVGSSTCSARTPSPACVRTHCKMQQRARLPRSCSNAETLFAWPRPTGCCTERSLVKFTLRSTSATSKKPHVLSAHLRVSTMIASENVCSSAGHRARVFPHCATLAQTHSALRLAISGCVPMVLAQVHVEVAPGPEMQPRSCPADVKKVYKRQ